MENAWFYLVLILNGTSGLGAGVPPSQIIIPEKYGYRETCEEAGRWAVKQDRRYTFVCVPHHFGKLKP